MVGVVSWVFLCIGCLCDVSDFGGEFGQVAGQPELWLWWGKLVGMILQPLRVC